MLQEKTMCGIAGFTFDDSALIRKMCQVLQHRGPDDEGFYGDSNVTLGNKRLSIIDLVTGRQPIFNEDKSIVVVYNGEIYNFPELRAKLEEAGHDFYTNSDTEVIVHSYEEWNLDCLSKFNGMFAFALWDSSKKKLLLARDLCGIKPMYYTMLGNGRLMFASEIKAILQHETVKREVDLQAFHYYVNLRFVPGERTMFNGIKRLLPGHYLISDKNGVKTHRFEDIDRTLEEYSENYLVKKTQELLGRAVKRCLLSDVPLGVYLSGGIDSSSIVALASRMTSEPLKTFTMGFGEPTDEIEDARYVAEYFGTDHKELVVHSTLLKDYPKMIWYADMPKRNLYPYYIAREIGKYVKVVLSGLGGDELFAGYEWKYQFAEDVEEERRRMPKELIEKAASAARKLLEYTCKYGSVHEIEHIHHLKRLAYLSSDVDLYLLVMSLDEVFPKEYLPRIYGAKMLRNRLQPITDLFKQHFEGKKANLIDRILSADFKVKMPDDFLFVDDAMSMANSVEGRFPYLDKELVEFAFSIPSGYKFRDGSGKYILKKAAAKILPRRVLEKTKRGFGGTVGIQFSKELYEYARQLLPEGCAVKNNFIKKKYVNDFLSYKTSMSLTKHYIVIWDLLAFEVWYRMFILPDSIRKPEFSMDSLLTA